jgi:hypothetical protein
MCFDNDANLDAETYLLFTIYRRAARVDKRPTAKSYLKTFENEIRATARVLEWLRLVTFDKKNPFGCRPTEALMRIIARKPTRKKNEQARSDC